MYLLNKKDYEPCKGCSTLKAQLELSNVEKRELYETLLKLVKPEVIHQPAPNLIQPKEVFQRFSQRRESLEKQHAVVKDVKERSPFLATTNIPEPNSIRPETNAIKPESIDEMEARLGLNEVSKVEAN